MNKIIQGSTALLLGLALVAIPLSANAEEPLPEAPPPAADVVVEPIVEPVPEPAPVEPEVIVEEAPATLAEAVTLTVASRPHGPVDPVIEGWYSFITTPKPGVTDPQNANDVTWPQPFVGVGKLTPPCGVWYQVDPWKGKQSKINAILADNLLSMVGGQPEDHAVIQPGWDFVYGGDCVNVVDITPGAFVDTCSTGEIGDHGYTVTLPENTEFVHYGEEGGDIDGVNYVWIVATPQNGAVIAPPGEGDTYELTDFGARWAFTYTDESCVTINPCEANLFEGFEERGGLWEVTYGMQHTDTNGVPVFTNDSYGGLVEFNEGPIPAYMTGAEYRWLYVYGDTPGNVWTWDFADETRVTATVSYSEAGCPEIVWEYGTTPPTEVDPAEPVWIDPCGDDNGYWSYENGEGYSFNALPTGELVLAAAEGYAFPEGQQTWWQESDSGEECPDVVIEGNPLVPTFDDFCGEGDQWNLPTLGEDDHYSFDVDDQRDEDGVGTVSITAVADEGYTFGEETVTSWSHDFTNEACPTTVTETPPGGGLADTGAEARGLLTLAGFLIIGGLTAALVAAFRRRQTV